MNPLLEISSSRFTWELYCSQVGWSNIQIIDWSTNNLCAGVKLIGYCDAGRIAVRARPGEYVVMVEMETGEKTWCHVSITQLEFILGSDVK